MFKVSYHQHPTSHTNFFLSFELNYAHEPRDCSLRTPSRVSTFLLFLLRVKGNLLKWCGERIAGRRRATAGENPRGYTPTDKAADLKTKQQKTFSNGRIHSVLFSYPRRLLFDPASFSSKIVQTSWRWTLETTTIRTDAQNGKIKSKSFPREILFSRFLIFIFKFVYFFVVVVFPLRMKKKKRLDPVHQLIECYYEH